MTKLSCAAMAVCSWMSLASPMAALQPERPVVTFQLDGPAGTVAPGGTVTTTMRARIEPGWRLYALTQPVGGPQPTRITLPEGQSFVLAAPISAPTPVRKPDPNFDLETSHYESVVTFGLALQVRTGAAPGPATLDVEVRYQACTDDICLRPRTVRVTREVTVGHP
jgi:DsbC/DsbD-like thiol-disulfide interchange protein